MTGIRRKPARLPKFKDSELRGFPFPKLNVYVTREGDTVYMCRRHRSVIPSDVHESLKPFDKQFDDGCCERMTQAVFQRLINVMTSLSACDTSVSASTSTSSPRTATAASPAASVTSPDSTTSATSH